MIEKGEFTVGMGRDLGFSRTPATAVSLPFPGVTLRIGDGRHVMFTEAEWLSINEWLGYGDKHAARDAAEQRADALYEQEGFLPGDLIEWSDANVKGMRGRVLEVKHVVLIEDTDEPEARFWLDMRDFPDKLQTRLLGSGTTRSGRQDGAK